MAVPAFSPTGARSSRTAAQGSRNSIAVDLFISFMIWSPYQKENEALQEDHDERLHLFSLPTRRCRRSFLRRSTTTSPSMWTTVRSTMAARTTTSRCALTQTVFSIPTKPLPSASTGPTIPRAARQLIDYIGAALESAPCVELWHVWQGGFYSFDERPVIHRAAVRFDEFVVDDLRELGETDLWNNKETNRLSFYCLTVTR